MLPGSYHCWISAHRGGALVRVGMIQAGLADLASPTSIQPDSRVITIGASSERLAEERVWMLTIRFVDAVVEFVMAVSFLSSIG